MDIFAGELVRLTQIDREDLPNFVKWFQDYEVKRFLGTDIRPFTVEIEQEWLDRVLTESDEYHFSIRTLDGNRLIGNCGLFGFDWRNRLAEFGIVIGEQDSWGRGFGTDAARVIQRFAFGELNLNRLWLRVFDFNPRGMRSYEKAGFVPEGTLRAALYREGGYHDVHVMSILQSEWRDQTDA